MATFNRILIILITILALGAAALSYLLFERRNEFRDRAGLLAEAVVDMVKSLDEDSNTNVGKGVTFSKADPLSGLAESGTLSWEEYHNDKLTGYSGFKKTVDKAAELSANIAVQRNLLAQSLAQVGFDLEMPVEDLSVADLKRADDEAVYAEASRKVVRLAKAANGRSNDMIRALVNTSNVVGKPIDDREFRERVQDIDEDGRSILGPFKHGDALDGYVTNVTSLNTRCSDYGKAIADAIDRVSGYEWETDAAMVEDEQDYNRALTSLMNDFDEINTQIVVSEQRRVQVEKMTQELNEAMANLAEVTKVRDRLRAEGEEKDVRIRNLERIAQARPERGADEDLVTEMDPNIEGRIVQVNDEWHFVILNIGTRQKLQENVELLVARGDEFVARVVVTKVAPNIAVAEIIPDLQTGPVQVDDKVMLPAKTF